MKLTTEMERLRSFPKVLKDNYLSHPIEASDELATFLQTSDKLAKEETKGRPIDTGEVEELRRRCQFSGFNLSIFNKRETRILCRDEETVLNPIFLNNLYEAVFEGNIHIRIEPLIEFYFNRWGTIRDQPKFEKLINVLLQKYRRFNPWILEYKSLSSLLFSLNSNVFLAQEALNKRDSATNVIKKLGISETSALGQAAINSAVRLYLNEIQKTEIKATETQALNNLEYLTSKLLLSDMVDIKMLHIGLSNIVLNQRAEKSEAFRQKVIEFALNCPRLGNPRSNSHNWNLADVLVIQRVKSWLARKDIGFFFDFVLTARQDQHRRKDFWMKYLDQVQDSQVALCSEDRARLKSQVSEQMEYSKIQDSRISAFLMHFTGQPDIVVVEFSQIGNAAYIYEANVFSKTVGKFQQRIFSIYRLKHGRPLTTVTHYPPGQWQQKVIKFLAGRGVRMR